MDVLAMMQEQQAMLWQVLTQQQNAKEKQEELGSCLDSIEHQVGKLKALIESELTSNSSSEKKKYR